MTAAQQEGKNRKRLALPVALLLPFVASVLVQIALYEIETVGRLADRAPTPLMLTALALAMFGPSVLYLYRQPANEDRGRALLRFLAASVLLVPAVAIFSLASSCFLFYRCL